MATTHTESWGIEPRPGKYSAKPTVVDAIRFASKLEAKRYSELKLLERAGEIRGLRLHPAYPIVVNNIKVGRYEGDFEYVDVKSGATVCEDTKGVRTPVYKLKQRLFLALYQDIEHREVRA